MRADENCPDGGSLRDAGRRSTNHDTPVPLRYGLSAIYYRRPKAEGPQPAVREPKPSSRTGMGIEQARVFQEWLDFEASK